MTILIKKAKNIERDDEARFVFVMAVVFSVTFHVIVLILVKGLNASSISKPEIVNTVEVSLEIAMPESNVSSAMQEEEKNQEVKSEELFSEIIPKKKIIKTVKKIEVEKPKNESPSSTVQNTSLEEKGTQATDSSVIPSVEARPIDQVKPEIPDVMKTSEYKSYVRVKVEIDANGNAISTLKTSSGNQLIDRRVLEALDKWKWQPALVDSSPVSSVRYFKFEFEVK